MDTTNPHPSLRLTISLAAANRIAEILAPKPAGTFLRVEVVTGGCHGFNVKFSLDDTLAQDDIEIIDNGQKVVCDTTSLDIISGSTIEYSSSLMGKYFWLNVAGAKNKCSCGSSFSI